MPRPWANGLARLLTNRRLKKGDLADLAGVRAGTVSAVANSPKNPDIATLQRLADGFTAFDRQGNPHAPAVELWEFFVSDEQADLLRQASQSQKQLVRQEDLAALVIQRLAPAVASAIRDVTTDVEAIPPHSATEIPTPAEHPARGSLQRRRRPA